MSTLIEKNLEKQKLMNAVAMPKERLRLFKARQLMTDENKNVTKASIKVSYISASQFIKDYVYCRRIDPHMTAFEPPELSGGSIYNLLLK